MDAGVAAVIGAAIGTVGGVGGGLVTALSQGRQQRRQREIDRALRLDDARRDAYGACISASKQVSAAWWRVAAVLRSEAATEEQRLAAAAEAHAAWAPFSAAAAAVTVVGPGFVADSAETLRKALYDLDMAGVAWCDAAREGGGGRLAPFDERYMRAVEAKREPGREFQRAARAALNAEV